MEAVRWIDQIIPYHTEKDLTNLLKLYKIDVRFLGEEYRDVDFTGRDFCEENGIELFFNRRKHDFSTSELRKRIYEQDG